MKLPAVAAVLITPVLVPCQSQCSPPTHLATLEPFQITHYHLAPGQNNAAAPPIPQFLPLNYVGHLTVADITANANLIVSRIDLRLADDGFIRFNWGPAPGVAGPPGLVGQPVAVNVYLTPTTWVGQIAWPIPPVWTPVATGTLTVAPSTQHSAAVFAPPFTVPVGTHGIAIELSPVTVAVPAITYMPPPYALHPMLLLPAHAPGTPQLAADQFLTIANTNITNEAWVVPPTATPQRIAVFDVHYTVAPNAAHFTPYSTGCYDRPQAFYEVFAPAPGAFDLSNSAFAMVPTPSGEYSVAACPLNIVPPSPSSALRNASNSPLEDDDRTAALPLGFPFRNPTGSTSSIVITTNGNIFLDPANSGIQRARFMAFGAAGFLKGQPQLAPIWCDWDPSITTGAGTVHLEFATTPLGRVAYVTWLNVAEWNVPGSANTFQVALYHTGRVEYHYGNCAAVHNPALVGWTPGWSYHDPGVRDISTTLPFTTGDGAVPPFLTMSARPVLGSLVNLVVRDLPTGIGSLWFGAPLPAPVNLGFLGMPGCMLHLNPVSPFSFATTGPTASLPWSIPGTSSLAGLQLTAQGAVLAPGANALGITLSNALCISLGL